MKIAEVTAPSMYFIRATPDPAADLRRNFSCHWDGWVDTQEDAIQRAQAEWPEAPATPRQDPNTRSWCFMPEPGLSGYAFHDRDSLWQAITRFTNEIGYAYEDEPAAIFVSNKFELESGYNGEDCFWDAKVVLRLPRLGLGDKQIQAMFQRIAGKLFPPAALPQVANEKMPQ